VRLKILINKNMKKLLGFLTVLFFITACSKDDRVSGVCYCKFANGEKQEYDLTNLTRQEQIEKCNTHDTNANKFGGTCDLE